MALVSASAFAVPAVGPIPVTFGGFARLGY